MKIAFLTPEYPHTKIIHAAGIGTSIKNLTSALVHEGVSVTVFVYGQKTQEVIVENGINIHLIKNKKYKYFGWFLHRKYIEKYCKSVIREENIQLLEAADWTGIIAFMKFNIPLLIRFHGSDTYFCHLEQRKQKIKNFWFEKLAVLKADAFIAPTSFAGELSRKLFKIKNKTIQTIHYGLDLAQFKNNTLGLFEKGLIVYVGTIIRKKGVLELAAIFNKVREKHPNARLLLIGSDAPDIEMNSASTWELLSKMFTDEDKQYVSYIGKKPYEEVQEYIKKANVCVFPTFAETLGMVTIEAMAMQKAVVNSNIGWAQELIVDGESGYLVHPKDHDQYAEKIADLLENEILCQQMGKQAKLRVESKFDIKKLVKDNIDFYQRVIHQNSNQK
jgi:glycosyltransferase involved in cell wall biosynthesis